MRKRSSSRASSIPEATTRTTAWATTASQDRDRVFYRPDDAGQEAPGTKSRASPRG